MGRLKLLLCTDRVLTYINCCGSVRRSFEAEVFKGRMPFLSPSQLRQGIEGIIVVGIVVGAVTAAAMAAVAAALVFTSFLSFPLAFIFSLLL